MKLQSRRFRRFSFPLEDPQLMMGTRCPRHAGAAHRPHTMT